MRPFKLLLCSLFILLQSGCMSVNKAKDYLIKHDALADVCAKEYPVDSLRTIHTVDSLHTIDTVTLTDQVYQTDTVQVGDTVFITRTIRIKDVIKYYFRDSIVIRDRANEAALQIQIQSLTKKSIQDETTAGIYKKQRNNWMLYFFIACAAFLGLLFYQFSKAKVSLFSEIGGLISKLKSTKA